MFMMHDPPLSPEKYNYNVSNIWYCGAAAGQSMLLGIFLRLLIMESDFVLL